MKKHILTYILLLAPIALWAQSDEVALDEIDLSDVVVVEDTSGSAPADVSLPQSQSTVVEIPDVAIDGASIDIETPEIPEVTVALPEETEIVLELPGQEAANGATTIANEETISVDFPDEDVRTILRNVADLFDLNLVIPDTLQGRTSIKLRNITWRQVFEVVLDPLGYTYLEDRNIIRIKSVEELTTEPVDTRIFVANYARAEELQNSISPLVDAAAGGRVQVDVRSNALVITERPSRMNKIQEIIERLDKATDQVMIESKFIEVSRDDSEDIGIDWAFIDPKASDLLGGDGVGSGDPGLGSTPAGVISGIAPTTLGGGLVAVFSRQEFAATLTALEETTDTRLVSNPTVVVMNNQRALFQVGEDYPVREFTVNRETGELESGELTYRFVGIELDVTPSVNAAGMINLDIKPMVSARLEDEVVIGPDGIEDQIFRTREAHTKVTIKDGYTIALGGLTDSSESKGLKKIPLMGDLPLVGRLFRNDSDTVTTSNLIIFLTAKTLNPDGSTYRDIIDPRKLDAVGHTESQTPGYTVQPEEMAVILSAEEAREKAELSRMRTNIEKETSRLEEKEKTWAEKLKLVDEPAE